MANIGLKDIKDFEVKVQFSLMVLSIPKITKIIEEDLEDNITSVTLEAWKSGKNKPSKTKLELFCRAIGLEIEDIYCDFNEYVEIICRIHNVSERNQNIYLKRIEERSSGSIKLSIFSHFDISYIQRLFNKISGNYILYNYSINNLPEINTTLLSIDCQCHPFIRVVAKSLRENNFILYTGSIFPVRSNLHFVMETDSNSVTHDEVVMIVTNNPVDMGIEVKFLYGIIVSGSEDFVSHPSAARVFIEKMPDSVSLETLDEKLRTMTQEDIPGYCKHLVSNDISLLDGSCVLRSEQLNIAFVERLIQEEVQTANK